MFGKRLNTNLLRHRIFIRPHVIGFVEDLFSTLKSGLKKCSDSLSNSPDACGWKRIEKEKVADSKISGYVGLGP